MYISMSSKHHSSFCHLCWLAFTQLCKCVTIFLWRQDTHNTISTIYDLGIYSTLCTPYILIHILLRNHNTWLALVINKTKAYYRPTNLITHNARKILMTRTGTITMKHQTILKTWVWISAVLNYFQERKRTKTFPPHEDHEKLRTAERFQFLLYDLLLYFTISYKFALKFTHKLAFTLQMYVTRMGYLQ